MSKPVVILQRVIRDNGPIPYGYAVDESAEFDFESDAEAAWAFTLAHDAIATFKQALEKLRD